MGRVDRRVVVELVPGLLLPLVALLGLFHHGVHHVTALLVERHPDLFSFVSSNEELVIQVQLIG